MYLLQTIPPFISFLHRHQIDAMTCSSALDTVSQPHKPLSRLRFKVRSKKRRERSEDDLLDQDRHRNGTSSECEHRQKRRSTHRHDAQKRYKASADPGGNAADPPRTTNAEHGGYAEPDKAARESLLDSLSDPSRHAQAETRHAAEDAHAPSPVGGGAAEDDGFYDALADALADDEGAAYWEGVYGQPLHTYANARTGPDGALERMTDDEYAAFVREKMWEKTHEGLLAAREADERARLRRKEEAHQQRKEQRRRDREADELRRRMEQSMEQGRVRKQGKEAAAAWDRYLAGWHAIRPAELAAHEDIRTLLPWPVVSGNHVDVTRDAIEFFFRNAPAWKDRRAAALLKAERVRWHPDKVQQRFGARASPESVKLVTAVFQVVDQLWAEEREGR